MDFNDLVRKVKARALLKIVIVLMILAVFVGVAGMLAGLW